MSKPPGRIGDIGIGTCSPHPGTIGIITTMVTGAATVGANGIPVTTRLSLGLSTCGHVSIVSGSSQTTRAEGQGVHRIGDLGLLPGGTYILTTGSPDSTTGD
jgi:hypothetical protein